MSECICPDDGREIPSDSRLHVIPPGAEKDKKLLIIFNKDCPKHGYTVEEE